jgi:chromosomal replication initiation ATPase DnaA
MYTANLAGLLPPAIVYPQETPGELARAIVARVARRHRVDPSDLMSDDRTCVMTYARQEAYARVRDDLGWSYPRIGRFFGRNHATVMFGIKRHRARCGA